MSRLRVYLSSTFEDLKEYRAAVFAALEKAGLDVARMEDYTSADDRPLDLCLRDVGKSEIYVGLIAWRYGYWADCMALRLCATNRTWEYTGQVDNRARISPRRS
jgi:Domain of unknown function (DUF4062)